MELSERVKTLSPSITLEITNKAKKMKADGIDVCGFAGGEPDFDTPDHIKQAAKDALDAGMTKYTPSAGLPELRKAIADKLLADNNLAYEPSQVIVSCGAKHSCMNAILATCDAQDEVIIPAPYWLSYPEMVRVAGATPVIVQTTAESGWKITPQQFEEAMSPRTKMIILNTPGNPTGSVYTREELEALGQVALEEDIMILSDEIYEKLVYDDVQHVSIASISEELYDLTVTINGFSKAYSMTGWRLGYLAAPAKAAAAINSLQSHMTSNATSFAQMGAIAALKGDQQIIEDMRMEFDIRRQYMLQRLEAMPRLSVIRPQGAFYVLADISKTELTSQNFADRLLSKANVAVIPGAAFGADHTVRFSYTCGMDVLKKGLDRLQEFCAGL